MDTDKSPSSVNPSLPDHCGQWCVIANVVRDERNGRDQKRKYFGTPVFAPGAKVYVGLVFWGTGASLCVLGQNRVTKRIVPCVVSIKVLENFRTKVIYSQAIQDKLLTLSHDNYKKFFFGGTNTAAGKDCLHKTEEACNFTKDWLTGNLATYTK